MVYQIADGRKHLAQWDTGQRLLFQDERVNEVHFAYGWDKALVVSVDVGENGQSALIPNICLQKPNDLIVYFVTVTDEQEAATIDTVTIPLVKRRKPEDYDGTEDAVVRWETVERRVEAVEAEARENREAVELARQAAETAKNTAIDAAEKAAEAVVRAPKISENETWMVWDYEAGCYVDTGVRAWVQGAKFIPTVSEDGIISWENDQDLPNPKPVDIKGPADHRKLENRDAGGSHPIEAISGLDEIGNMKVLEIWNKYMEG